MKSFVLSCVLLGCVACGNAPPFVPPTSSGNGSSTGRTTGTSAATTAGTTTAGTTTAGASTAGPGTTAGTTGGTTGPATSSGAGAGTTGGTTGTSTGAAAGTTSGSYIGQSCTFNNLTGADSCQPFGYECTSEYDTNHPATCVLPQELGVCTADVGCQDGGTPELTCAPGFNNNNNPVSLCTYPCTTANDCPSILETCISLGVCFSNYCDVTVAGTFQGPYFNSCPVDDAGTTGQCLSFNQGQFALCAQNGFDFPGTSCNPLTRQGTDSSCAFGSICLPSQEGGDGGECFPITIDGGCADGEDALPFFTNGDFGICVQDCAATGICDVGLCYSDMQTSELVCLP